MSDDLSELWLTFLWGALYKTQLYLKLSYFVRLGISSFSLTPNSGCSSLRFCFHLMFQLNTLTIHDITVNCYIFGHDNATFREYIPNLKPSRVIWNTSMNMITCLLKFVKFTEVFQLTIYGFKLFIYFLKMALSCRNMSEWRACDSMYCECI
jgi:hypothetical protein